VRTCCGGGKIYLHILTDLNILSLSVYIYVHIHPICNVCMNFEPLCLYLCTYICNVCMNVYMHLWKDEYMYVYGWMYGTVAPERLQEFYSNPVFTRLSVMDR
jgi:hypothetical protein